MIKKALLLSHQRNVSTIEDWYSLQQWQRALDLSLALGKTVEITSWANLKDVKTVNQNYDTIVLDEFDGDISYSSKYRKPLLNTLDKFVGKRLCLNESFDLKKYFDKDLYNMFKTYHKNSVLDKYDDFLKTKPNMVHGDRYALTLWTPHTRVVNEPGFNFRTDKNYGDFTVYVGDIILNSKIQLSTIVENLFKQSLRVSSKKVNVVLPHRVPMYRNRIIDLMKTYSNIYGTNLLVKTYSKIPNEYKQTIWNYDKHEIQSKYLPMPYTETP